MTKWDDRLDDQMKCIKDKEGKVLVEKVYTIRRWQAYLHKLLNEEGNKKYGPSVLQNFASCRDFGYIRGLNIKVVKDAIHKMMGGRPNQTRSQWNFGRSQASVEW